MKNPDAKIVVMGDFNDNPNNDSVYINGKRKWTFTILLRPFGLEKKEV